jgi:hypothetical protein
VLCSSLLEGNAFYPTVCIGEKSCTNKLDSLFVCRDTSTLESHAFSLGRA